MACLSTYDINFTRGASLSLNLVATDPATNLPLNLSGYNVRGQARQNYSSTGVMLDLAPTITSYVSGIINVNVHGSGTAVLPSTRGVYDIEIYNSSGYVLKLMGGLFLVQPESTR